MVQLPDGSHEAPPGAPRRSRSRDAMAPALVFLAVAIVWASPTSLSPASTMVDAGDPLHLAWVMAWNAHQLVRAPWALFESNTFHPYTRSLAFGDHLLPESLMVAPVFWATGNAALASNVALVLGLALSGFTMYVLVREATGSAAGAYVAGLAWSANGFTQLELARVHVLQLQWWPLALLALLRLALGTEARHAWLAVLFLGLQGLSSSYYLVYSALVAPLWWVAAHLAARRPVRAPELVHLGAATAVAGVVCLPLLLPYLDPVRSAWREKDVTAGIDVACFLVPPDTGLWGGLRGRSLDCAGAPFAGFVALSLAAWAVVLLLRGRCAPPARVVGFMALASLGAGLVIAPGPVLTVAGRDLGRGPYQLVQALAPVVRGMDGTQRASVLVVLGLAVLAGLGVAALTVRRSRGWRVAIPLVVALLFLAEHGRSDLVPTPVPTGVDVPEAVRFVARGHGPTVDLPLAPYGRRRTWSAYPYLSTYHWRPVVFGRTSFYPPAHDLLAWRMEDFPSASSILLLQRLGVGTVVVHPWQWEDAALRAQRLAELARVPALHLEARFPGRPDAPYAWMGLGDELVYRLEAGGHVGTPPCTPGAPVPPTQFTVLASPGADGPAPGGRRVARTRWKPELAADGDPGTTFTTDLPQRPGDRLVVKLAREETLAAVTLAAGRRFDEFPRQLKLRLIGGDTAGEWVEWADGPEERWTDVASFLDGSAARLTLRFPPRPVRRLELVLRGDPRPELPAWSVAEIGLHRDCR